VAETVLRRASAGFFFLNVLPIANHAERFVAAFTILRMIAAN
jgi:hypothetical protein